MRRKIIIIAVGLVVIVAAVGLYKYYQPQKDFAASKPDFTLTVEELFVAFEQDETAANEKFVANNSTVLVNGILSEVMVEADSTITLILTSPSKADAFVNCHLADSNPSVANQLKSGDAITVKGQCTGMQGLIDKAVYMMRAAVVE